MALGNLHNATNQVYALWSTTDLMSGWQVETEVWPTNASVNPFVVNTLGRSNLFLMAQDWTEVTHDGNTVPDWWLWNYFGTTNLSDASLDSQGLPLSYDYEDGLDPNVIQFMLNTANNYIQTSLAYLQLNISGGWPYYYAVSVDDTNYMADAIWQPCNGTNLSVNLGSTQGWHDVWIGLRGYENIKH
jgi:hypothetical protein